MLPQPFRGGARPGAAREPSRAPPAGLHCRDERAQAHAPGGRGPARPGRRGLRLRDRHHAPPRGAQHSPARRSTASSRRISPGAPRPEGAALGEERTRFVRAVDGLMPEALLDDLRSWAEAMLPLYDQGRVQAALRPGGCLLAELAADAALWEALSFQRALVGLGDDRVLLPLPRAAGGPADLGPLLTELVRPYLEHDGLDPPTRPPPRTTPSPPCCPTSVAGWRSGRRARGSRLGLLAAARLPAPGGRAAAGRRRRAPVAAARRPARPGLARPRSGHPGAAGAVRRSRPGRAGRPGPDRTVVPGGGRPGA
ncbi:MAG: hypothetical protein M0C28_41095 [Candidatus Moduliflexus flocculans]|nr:hypothetical protein [Candidatus Moduliflexus flocculans]